MWSRVELIIQVDKQGRLWLCLPGSSLPQSTGVLPQHVLDIFWDPLFDYYVSWLALLDVSEIALHGRLCTQFEPGRIPMEV
jgi:hypothetical protein